MFNEIKKHKPTNISFVLSLVTISLAVLLSPLNSHTDYHFETNECLSVAV